MKLIATYPLYKRSDASNDALPVGFINNGDAIEVVDIFFGKYLDGTNIWYKAEDGYYYWSGGFKDSGFALPGKNYFSLSKDEQYTLVSQAMKYYYDEFIRIGIDFTGMSATMKKREADKEYFTYYALVVHVQQKGNFSGGRIPENVMYNGFNIPTDVITVNIPVALTLGQKIKRRANTAWGTSGIVLKRNDNVNKFEKYLLTNYHVLCKDLLSFSPRKMNLNEEDLINNPEVVINDENNLNQEIGQLTRARLDNTMDIALVSLSAEVEIPNIFHNGQTLRKIRTIESIKNDFKPYNIVVKTFGASSAQLNTGFIVSFDTKTAVAYLGGSFIHEMSGLIKADLPSRQGDSGSIVLDNDDAIVGVLFAGIEEQGLNYSFIIPIEAILSTFKIAIP